MSLVRNLGLLLLLVGCARAPRVDTPGAGPATVPGARRLALFVSADVRGQLAPCGCSEAMRGGIGKAAAQLSQARAEGLPTLYVDGGDTLFERTGFGEDELVGERARARTLARAFAAMGLAAHAPGPLDDALGPEFRRSLGLPELPRGESRLLEAGGMRVGVVAGSDAPTLSTAATRLRAQGADFVLGLWAGPPASAERAAGVDLVVAAQAPELVGAEWDDGRLFRGAVPVAQVQSRGRSLLRVDVAPGRGAPPTLSRGQGDAEREFKAQGQRIELLKSELGAPGVSPERKQLLDARIRELVLRREALAREAGRTALAPGAFTVRFIPLEAALPSDPAVDALVADYDREVARENLAWARAHGTPCPPAADGEAAYVGSESCRSCHRASAEVWDRTGHAHAYATLERVSKQYRLDCVACHVVGFQQAGGVCRVDQVQGRENVGCENCHGPGSLHVARPVVAVARPRPGATLCVGCHTPENSVRFDFARYLPRVLGPGHGAPGAPAITPGAGTRSSTAAPRGTGAR